MTAQLCCAYLRAFQPAEVFSEADRERLVRAARDPVATGSSNALGLIAPEETREAYAKVIDGRTYVCRAQARLRALLGMVAFDQSLPDGVSSVFFAPEELEKARSELEELQTAGGSARPALLQSAWHVPLRWFVCFGDEERRIVQTSDHPTIVYETSMARASERVTSALEGLKGGIVHPVIVGMMFELKEWLGSFHPDSQVELDYASVASLFDADDLADDHSAADVWSAINALVEGDGMRAGLFYQRANERWLRVRQRESMN